MPDEWTFIIAAYSVTWVGFVGYAVRLYRLNHRAHEELRDSGGGA